MVKVLHDAFGIRQGYMVTIHSYTGDQHTVDTLHKDLRRARAAALSMIPTSTGAARSIGLVIPDLKGKLDGTAIRVPTPDVSLVSFDLVLKTQATAPQINDALKAASNGALRGILDTNTEKLVSIDFNRSPAFCTFDATQTAVVDDGFAHVVGWYDNEWGFSCRMLDTAALFGSLLKIGKPNALSNARPAQGERQTGAASRRSQRPAQRWPGYRSLSAGEALPDDPRTRQQGSAGHRCLAP
jgi:glyceraldehyde 3-phosphate dehydrogenase